MSERLGKLPPINAIETGDRKLRAELAESMNNGGLGRTREDLDLFPDSGEPRYDPTEAIAGARHEVNAAINSAAAPTEEIEAGPRVALGETVRTQPRNFSPKHRIYSEGVSSEEWDKRNRTATDQLHSKGGKTLTEQHAEYIEGRAKADEADEADEAMLNALSPGFVESGFEKYGRDKFIRILKGTETLPSLDDGEASLIHATTGDTMSIQEVTERISGVA